MVGGVTPARLWMRTFLQAEDPSRQAENRWHAMGGRQQYVFEGNEIFLEAKFSHTLVAKAMDDTARELPMRGELKSDIKGTVVICGLVGLGSDIKGPVVISRFLCLWHNKWRFEIWSLLFYGLIFKGKGK